MYNNNPIIDKIVTLDRKTKFCLRQTYLNYQNTERLNIKEWGKYHVNTNRKKVTVLCKYQIKRFHILRI